jgi:hypothetical protein
MSSAYSAGLSVAAYELDLFGRVRSLTDSCRRAVAGDRRGAQGVQISLVASVANQYLALAADDELLDLTLRTLDTREESLKLTQLQVRQRRRVGAGSAPGPDAGRSRPGHAGQAAPSARTGPQCAGAAGGQALPEWPAGPGRVECHRAGRCARRRALRGAAAPPRRGAGRTATRRRQREHRRRASRLLAAHHADRERRHGQYPTLRPVQGRRVELRGPVAAADLRRGPQSREPGRGARFSATLPLPSTSGPSRPHSAMWPMHSRAAPRWTNSCARRRRRRTPSRRDTACRSCDFAMV